MDLDTDTLEALGKVLAALREIPGVKVRTLTFDYNRASYLPRHRVRIAGDRSRYSRSVKVTNIFKMGS